VNAPWQALFALAWAVIGVPYLVYAATRPGSGKLTLHATLMTIAVLIEIAVMIAFGELMMPSPRRMALVKQPLFTVHLAFAIGSLVGMAWQLTSRTVPRLTALHQKSGPYVVLIWSLALLTGIYNYVFLYVLAP
jgi:uncharacterized membrane protein YozB (DUF420 family)